MKRTIVTSNTMESIDFIPTVILGFYKSTKKELFSANCELLKSRFPDVDIIGCSSESNLYNHSPHLDTDNIHLCVFACMDIDKDSYSLQKISTDHPEDITINPKGEYRALMLVSSYFAGMEHILAATQEKLAPNGLFGGIAGVSDITSEIAEIYFNGEYCSTSMLLWIIDQERYLLEGVTTHHFQPVGFKMEITGAEGNVIHEIENRPALDVIEEIVGTLTLSSIISFEHPFFLRHGGYLDFDEAPLCSIESIDRVNKTISMYRNVNQNDTIKVGISLDRKSQKEQLKIYNRYSDRKAVAFIFNCVGIKGHLGIMESLYLIHLKKSLQVPFMGFHTFGEIGPSNVQNISILHNQTISLALLSERGE